MIGDEICKKYGEYLAIITIEPAFLGGYGRGFVISGEKRAEGEEETRPVRATRIRS